MLVCVFVLLIVYGSLIPFDFEWSGAVEKAGSQGGALLNMLGSPNWQPAPESVSALGVPFVISDLIVNLMLYIPLGVTLRLALRTWRWGWLIDLPLVVVVGFGLSWGVESLQSLMTSRVSALNDVVFNAMGALIGALGAVVLWSWIKTLSFAIYCRGIDLGCSARRWLRRPAVAMFLAVTNALVIGGWYALEVQRAAVSDGGVLPFERAFNLPYDMGAVFLGQGLLVYAGIGCLLLLLTYSGARRLAMNWVVLGVVLIAFAAELSRAVTQGSVPDITGPLLALSAASAMTITVYTFSLAVRRMNRRHDDRAYDGPDRRRRPYSYH